MIADRVAEAVDDDRLVAALDRVHAVYMEYSLLSDLPSTSWTNVVAPALQVIGPGRARLS